MKDKKEALVKDLAKLFVKYDLEDWKVVIDAFQNRGAMYDALASGIDDLSSRRSKCESKSKIQKGLSSKFFKEMSQSDPKRAEVIRDLHEKFLSKNIAPSLTDLREFSLSIGIKTDLPKKRDSAVLRVLQHLAGMSDKNLETALLKLPMGDRNLQEEYKRWFKLIYTS